MQCAVSNFSLPTVSPISFSRFLRCLWYYQVVELPSTNSLTLGKFFLLLTPLHQCAMSWKFTFKDFPLPAPSAINSIFCLSSWSLESHLLHSCNCRQLPGISLPCTSCKLPRLSSTNRLFCVFWSGLDVTEQLLGLSWMFVGWNWVAVKSCGAFYAQPKPTRCSWWEKGCCGHS